MGYFNNNILHSNKVKVQGFQKEQDVVKIDDFSKRYKICPDNEKKTIETPLINYNPNESLFSTEDRYKYEVFIIYINNIDSTNI